MSARRTSWLETLARRAARPAPERRRSAPPSEEIPDRPSQETPYSRRSVLALAGVAASTSALGLWSPSRAAAAPTRSADLASCVDGCNRAAAKYDRGLVDACRSKLPGLANTGSWSEYVSNPAIWFYVPGTFLLAVGQGGCAIAGIAAARAYRAACNDSCAQKCRNRPEQCQPFAPPKPPPPALPTPPKTTDDQCANCEKVGGTCCGYKPGPTPGTFQLCACATKGVDCSRYGC